MSAKDKAKTAMALASAGALAAAITVLAGRKVSAAELVSLDEASIKLLLTIAQAGVDQATLLQEVVTALADLSIDVQGYVPNVTGIIATRVLIVAANQQYSLPDIEVPDDMFLQIKGWPTNLGIIYVSGTRTGATNENQVWPLLANEAIGYRIRNADEIYVSGTIAGDFAVVTAEQKGGR